MKEILSILRGIGLTDGEIKVYLALLELGQSTTGTIIKSAHVSRSKVYEMLDKLLEKGLVSFVIKENTNYFEAAQPSAIINYVQKKKKKLTEKIDSLKKTLPALEQLQKTIKIQQTASVYEGIKGIKSMYNEILTSLRKGDSYHAIAVEKSIYLNTEFATFIKNFHLRRAEKGIHVKLLANKSLKHHITEISSKLIQFRFYKQNIPAATIIYKSNVATFVWGPTPTAIVMRSPIIAERYKKFFEQVWAEARK